MGTIERRILKSQSSDSGQSATSIGASLALVGSMLPVPRNTRMRAISSHVALADAEPVTGTSNRISIGLFRGEVDILDVNNLIDSEFSHLKTLWALVLSRQIVGTPSNQLSVYPTISKDWTLTKHVHNLASSKGSRSNRISGFAIAAIAASASYDIMFDSTTHFEMEYLGGSGSRKNLANSWISDEEETT